MPSIAKKQINRDNTEGDNPKTYYRQVFALPFVDKLINELDQHSASAPLPLIPLLLPKYHWAKVHTKKSLKCMERICLTKIWLTLSYRHGNANGLNVMRNCD